MRRLLMVSVFVSVSWLACDRLSAPEPPLAAAAPEPSVPAKSASTALPADDEAILAAALSVHADCLRMVPGDETEGRVDALLESAGLDRARFESARQRAAKDPTLAKVVAAGARHCPKAAAPEAPPGVVLEPLAPPVAQNTIENEDLKARVLDFMVSVACNTALAGDPKALDALLEERGFTAESFAAAAQVAQADPGFGDALVKRVVACAPVPVPPVEPPPPIEPPPPVEPPPPPEPPSPGGCRHDRDCKGERVCVERRCVFP